jgi:hypothetical protein
MSRLLSALVTDILTSLLPHNGTICFLSEHCIVVSLDCINDLSNGAFLLLSVVL